MQLLQEPSSRPQAQYWIKFLDPWAQDLYPILSEVSKRGLVDRGGWQEEIRPMPEIEASFLLPFSYASLRSRGTHFWSLGHISGLVSTQPPPANPFSKPLILGWGLAMQFGTRISSAQLLPAPTLDKKRSPKKGKKVARCSPDIHGGNPKSGIVLKPR